MDDLQCLYFLNQQLPFAFRAKLLLFLNHIIVIDWGKVYNPNSHCLLWSFEVKFLVIRTDNIGDLICTTPLIHTLRAHYPKAKICALVNSYNAPVLHHNPDLDAIYAYTKGKHRGENTLLGAYWRRMKLMWQLRREKFDYAILAGAGLRHKGLQFARLLGVKHIIGYTIKACLIFKLRQSMRLKIPINY